jgi:hypothetical protein
VRGLLKFYRITLAPRKTNQPNSDFIQGVGELARHEFLAKAVSQFVYLSLSASGRMRIEFKDIHDHGNYPASSACIFSGDSNRAARKRRGDNKHSRRYRVQRQRRRYEQRVSGNVSNRNAGDANCHRSRRIFFHRLERVLLRDKQLRRYRKLGIDR